MEIGIIIKESCPERYERLRKIRGENKKEKISFIKSINIFCIPHSLP